MKTNSSEYFKDVIGATSLEEVKSFVASSGHHVSVAMVTLRNVTQDSVCRCYTERTQIFDHIVV